MENRRIIVVGASAGGLEALSTLVKSLPVDLAAPVLIVLHIAPDSPGYLPEILAQRGNLPAKNAEDGEKIKPGQIYVAPPNRHMLLENDGRVTLTRGPRENRTRPAIDPLFRSAALAFGRRVIGVVLTGGLDDGTVGLQSIKMCGGLALVQDPDDAVAKSMPRSALRNVTIDYCKPVRELGPLIIDLVNRGTPQATSILDRAMEKELKFEVDAAKGLSRSLEVLEYGTPSTFTCPDCHGALLRLSGEHPLRFRCHTGHAFTADALVASVDDATEQALWSSARSLQEAEMLATHLAEHLRASDPAGAENLSNRAEAARFKSEQIRKLLRSSRQLAENPEPVPSSS